MEHLEIFLERQCGCWELLLVRLNVLSQSGWRINKLQPLAAFETASHDPSNPPEAGGLEGPCDATIVLEEMRPFLEIDATEDQVNREREKELEQGNHLQSLDKNDTAYHWNLRVLDLSNNELERR
ncbi:hypothetical protein CRUP_029865 [Coryphaenoides rupestris]|nr:hypothetical protein CRUP_029865 [Coryphaenoides rupestris]